MLFLHGYVESRRTVRAFAQVDEVGLPVFGGDSVAVLSLFRPAYRLLVSMEDPHTPQMAIPDRRCRAVESPVLVLRLGSRNIACTLSQSS